MLSGVILTKYSPDGEHRSTDYLIVAHVGEDDFHVAVSHLVYHDDDGYSVVERRGAERMLMEQYDGCCLCSTGD